MTDNALTVRDEMSAERNKIVEFEQRIAEYLPGSQNVPKPIRLAMAQIAIAHGLDPFLKEVWPIPQKNRNGDITGWDLMIGIAGWRAAAWRSNEYWGRRFEKCSIEERQWLGAQSSDIAIKCIVMRRRTGQKPMEFDGYGLFRTGHEFSKMNPLQCVRNRAERDAMKAAFPISLPIGVSVRVADEETGEVINGTSHGVEWQEPIATQQDAEIIEQESSVSAESLARVEARRRELCGDDDTLDQLSEVAERDAVTNAPAPTAPPEPTQPKPVKKCSIKTPLFASRLIPALAEKTKYYNDGKDAPQPYHVLGSAAKCGYSEITAENVEAVLNDLVQHAIEQQLEVPQAQA